MRFAHPFGAACLSLTASRSVASFPRVADRVSLPQAGLPDNYPKPHTPNVRARWAVVVLPARACATAPPPLDRGKGGEGQGV